MDELIEHEASTRRGLLHALARAAARRAGEVGSEFAPLAPEAPTRWPARVPVQAATLDELIALAHAEGLARRDDELRALAKRSMRMTPTQAVDAEAWIRTRDDGTDAEVLQALISLAAATRHGCDVPSEGWLALFVEGGGSEARRAHGAVLDMPVAIPDASEPVAMHPELVIPRRWHEAVQALDLDDGEAEAYDRLRIRLQELQGTEDDGDGGALIAYHRLFGYPNETTGQMPEDCGRALREWSAHDGVESDPLLPSQEWQLLAQVSVGERRRAYVWIRRTDRKAGEFGGLCAFVR